jgi:hypothetical protein
MSKDEIIYRGYLITFNCGYYWITGSKNPHKTLSDAESLIDFWMDEELAYMD